MNKNYVEKKKIIINAAMEILLKKNFHTMKTAEIAKVAGIGEGTIYNYFKNKRDLFIEVIRHTSNILIEYYFNDMDYFKNLKEGLESIAKKFLIDDKKFIDYYKILYKAFSEVDDQEIKIQLFSVFNESIEKVKKIFIKKFNVNIPERKLEIILMMLFGFGDVYWKKIVLSESQPFTNSDIKTVVEIFYLILSNITS